jgi:hypothetical protein
MSNSGFIPPTGLPHWHRNRTSSTGDVNGSNRLIPTRFIFEKIESTRDSDPSGYDVSDPNAVSGTVVYRSTFQIFVSAEDAESFSKDN